MVTTHAAVVPDIVDAQVHMTPEPGAAGLITAMDALGIRSVLLEEFWGFDARKLPQPCAELPGGQVRPLSPLATAAAIRHPDRFAFVQRVSWDDPGLAEVISALADTPGCRGLRVHLFEPHDLEAFQDGRCDALLQAARRHDLTVGFLAKDAGSALRATIARFSDQRIVIDHCGWPRGVDQWNDVLALAELPHVWLKWSHARRAFRGGNPLTALRAEFKRALERFGCERVLWASDVTHDAAGRPWAELLADVQGAGLASADLAWVLARSARTAYRWNAAATADRAH